MNRPNMRVSIAVCLQLVLWTVVDSCTTLVAGPKATADGSIMAAHSNDGVPQNTQ